MTELITTHADLITLSLLIALPLVLLVMTGVVVVLFRSLRLTSRQVQTLHSAADLNAASQARISEALFSLEKKLAQITEQNLDIQNQTFVNSSIDEATRLASRGVPAATLIDTCGLTDGEAELMVRLHQQSVRAQA